MSARTYWHQVSWPRGRTCWVSPFAWRYRLCIRCAWRTMTGQNRAAARRWAESMQRFRDCPHANTRHNPDATAVLDRNPRVCLDCGIGIVGSGLR